MNDSPASSPRSLGLRALSRGARLGSVGAATLGVQANQVTLVHVGAVQERYAYGPFGLEQGFTIGRRPSGPAANAAVLALGQLPCQHFADTLADADA